MVLALTPTHTHTHRHKHTHILRRNLIKLTSFPLCFALAQPRLMCVRQSVAKLRVLAALCQDANLPPLQLLFQLKGSVSRTLFKIKVFFRLD